jgi:hypothetical protein
VQLELRTRVKEIHEFLLVGVNPEVCEVVDVYAKGLPVFANVFCDVVFNNAHRVFSDVAYLLAEVLFKQVFVMFDYGLC